MEIIFALLPISLVLAIFGLFAYIWCVRDGQYDDLESPPLRMLTDDENRIVSNQKKPPLGE